MASHHQMTPEVQSQVAEILEGLREYQMSLVDLASKVTDANIAQKLYNLANEHAAFEAELQQLRGNASAALPRTNSPFLNQIRTLGRRLRHMGDFSQSRWLLCEIIQTEERMVRRYNVLIDQISDLRWRRKLSQKLSDLLMARDGLGRMGSQTSSQTAAADPGLSAG